VNVDIKIKNWFFDKPRVMAAVKDAKRRSFSRIGAFVRTAARSLLRRRKAASAPGSPPSVHSDSPVASLKYILFGYDPFKESVVIGPVRLSTTDRLNGVFTAGTVPQLHEFGGVATVDERSRDGGRTWWRRDHRRSLRPGEITRQRSTTYPARPFMGPALAKEIAKGTVASAWADSVKAVA